MSTIYAMNKGINRSVEFKGIKAQYIMYMAIGLVILLLFFIICYIAGVNMYLCLAMVGFSGYALMTWVIRYSRKYGEYGLLKESGYRQVPAVIRCHSRKVFLHLDPYNSPA